MQLGEYSLFRYHNNAQYLDASAGWELWFPETNNWNNRGMRQENQTNNYKDNLPNTNNNNIFIWENFKAEHLKTYVTVIIN